MKRKGIFRLVCGHVVIRVIRDHYDQPAGTHWCPQCCTYKLTKETLAHVNEKEKITKEVGEEKFVVGG